MPVRRFWESWPYSPEFGLSTDLLSLGKLAQHPGGSSGPGTGDSGKYHPWENLSSSPWIASTSTKPSCFLGRSLRPGGSSRPHEAHKPPSDAWLPVTFPLRPPLARHAPGGHSPATGTWCSENVCLTEIGINISAQKAEWAWGGRWP